MNRWTWLGMGSWLAVGGLALAGVAPVGSEFQVNVHTPYGQYGPVVAMTAHPNQPVMYAAVQGKDRDLSRYDPLRTLVSFPVRAIVQQ